MQPPEVARTTLAPSFGTMLDPALTTAERAFLAALEDLDVAYIIVGLTAAVLQGADTRTADIDLWFRDRTDPRINDAVKRVGGVWVSGTFGMMPPTLGGDALGDRFDVVLTLDGLEPFDVELAGVLRFEVDGLKLPVLPLARVIQSKKTARRPKDLAVLPALEAALAASDDS